MHITKKVGLAAAMVVTLLLAVAAPAAAGGPFPIEVTAGTLETVVGDFDPTPGDPGGWPCPPEPTTLALSTDEDAHDGTGSPGDWSILGGYSAQFQLFGSGPWYQADVTFVPGSGGTWAGTSSPYGLTGVLGIQVFLSSIGQEPFDEENPPDCDKDPTICTATMVFAVAGTFTGSLPDASVGDEAVISGSTLAPLVVSNCAPPFNALGGTHVTLTDLALEVVP